MWIRPWYTYLSKGRKEFGFGLHGHGAVRGDESRHHVFRFGICTDGQGRYPGSGIRVRSKVGKAYLITSNMETT